MAKISAVSLLDSRPREDALIVLCSDFLRWPGGTEDDMEGACIEPAPDELHKRLTSVLATFCPNLNCLRTLCTSHSKFHCKFLIYSIHVVARASSVRVVRRW